jgi:hypothetical protein
MSAPPIKNLSAAVDRKALSISGFQTEGRQQTKMSGPIIIVSLLLALLK